MTTIIQLSNRKNLSGFFGLCLVCFVLLSTSCKKEILTEQQVQPFTPSLRESPAAPCLKPIKIFCDSILWFENEQHYEMVYQCLEQAYEAHNDWFDQQTQNMSDEDAEAYAASIGFNEDQPLIDFEAFQNFYSYRRWLDTHEETWANQGINSLTYNYTLDFIQNTLISRSRMIRIGSITYYYHSDSETYVIKTEDCSVIDLAKNDIEGAIQHYGNQVSLLLQTKKIYSANCGFYYSEEGGDFNSVDYSVGSDAFRYDWKVYFEKKTITDPPPNSSDKKYTLHVEMINFKLRPNNRWRKKRVESKCEGMVYFYDDDFIQSCNYDLNKASYDYPNQPQQFRKRRRRMNKVEQESFINLYISDSDLYKSFGEFYIKANPSAYQKGNVLID